MTEKGPTRSVCFRFLWWGGAGFLVLPLVMAVLRIASAAAALPAIAVTVVESDGIERRSWPLTFGVPFPRASLRAVTGLSLVDEKGTAEPLQARVLSH